MVPLIWVFFIGLVTDIFWAWYITWTAEKVGLRPLRPGGHWSGPG